MNPQEKDNRAERRDDRNREEKGHEAASRDKTGKSSRLGREAKIGAAVILVLLVTFAAVVVMRLSKGEGDNKELASAADNDAEHHKPPFAPSHDPLFNGVDSKSFGNRQPTVVTPAKEVSSGPLGGIDGNAEKWKSSLEKSEPRPAGSRYSAAAVPPSAPPAFAVKPPEPHSSRYEPVAGQIPPNPDFDKHGHLDKKPKEPKVLPLDLPEPKKRAAPAEPIGTVVSRENIKRGEPGGFAAANSAASLGNLDKPRPADDKWGREDEKARRSDEKWGREDEKWRRDEKGAALMPPPPVSDRPEYKGGDRPYNDRSYAATPVSQYEDQSAGDSQRPRDFDRPRRHDNSPYGGPPARHDGKYEVQPGDNYSRISQTLYGTDAYFKALAELNHGKIGDENRLMPGDLITAPSVAELEKAFPDLCPKQSRRETQEARLSSVSTRQSYRGGRTYKVTDGDTLFNIARYELGKASRWVEIYNLNRDVLGKEYNYLTPGMQLVLPDNEKPDVLTRKSGELVR